MGIGARIKQRRLWLFLLFLAGAGAVWVGKSWVFVEAHCPHLLDFLLYTWAPIATFVALLWAVLTKNDSAVVQLLSVVVLTLGILLPVSLGGAYLSEVPQFQAVYCPSRACDEVEFVRSLRQAGRTEAAAEAARNCVEIETSSEDDYACVRQCAEELVQILYETANPDSIPQWGDNNWFSRCQAASALLAEAHSVAGEHNLEAWTLTVEERQCRVEVACATPTPYVIPTPALEIEVLRTQQREQEALFDVRVLLDGQPIRDLGAEDFSISVGGQSVPFAFESRQADDPVCVIAVVDNSGSISPGLSQIRAAIEQINQTRKPSDELALVVFGAHTDISVEQLPSLGSLNPAVVDASGARTALWDSVLVGLETAQSCSADYRYIIALTDGNDNDSRQVSGDNLERAREVARRAEAEGVGICTVGVRSDVLEPGPLRQAAHGCGYFPAENFDEVASQFVAIFGHVRDFYRFRVGVQYVPPDRGVLLRVMNVKEVTIDFTDSTP